MICHSILRSKFVAIYAQPVQEPRNCSGVADARLSCQARQRYLACFHHQSVGFSQSPPGSLRLSRLCILTPYQHHTQPQKTKERTILTPSSGFDSRLMITCVESHA
ncbi:hypothetical protein OUZ56_009432 [Daphnia magna]|uniref:Uncharacterized protein n=1 Tax=Daphnia magna TaxID=35525 RepID=A0ABR0AG04_9CRUS|nr:hypothetical protein OUZ56_009432 [Daphnia magna]